MTSRLKLLLCNKASQDQKRIFSEMWAAYIRELSAFSNRIAAEEPSEEEVLGMWLDFNTEIYLMMLDSSPIGFLLLGINENKHEFSNWFIGEFYIAKQWQGQGIGKNIVKEMLKEKKGNYCCFILEENKRAISFWNNAFAENGYKDVSMDFCCGHTPYDCIFKMYSPIL